MAEFQEVMKQWVRARIAEGYGDDPLVTLPSCLLNENDFERLENEVMQWAAEHPEPVYPTWAEWLIKSGILLRGNHGTWQSLTTKATDPIPADIAEKLGLKPKEE